MSGSNSSAPDGGVPAAEALALTVQTVAVPDALARRRIGGRLTMLLVLLACAAPVIVSYLSFYVIRPEARSNYGTLVLPTREIPSGLKLAALDGKSVAPASLRGQWLLLLAGPAECRQPCEQRLLLQRQLREMLGRERDRVDKVWLVTDAGAIAPGLRSALEAGVPVQILRADAAEVGRWLTAPDAGAIEDHLYIVDPMGRYMMRMPGDPQPAKVKRDLERLLRASASWDTPGR